MNTAFNLNGMTVVLNRESLKNLPNKINKSTLLRMMDELEALTKTNEVLNTHWVCVQD